MGRKAFINSFCDKSKFTQNYEVFINAGSHADSESTFKVLKLHLKFLMEPRSKILKIKSIMERLLCLQIQLKQ